MTDEQIKRKKKRRRRFKIIRLLLIVAIIAGIYFWLTSSFFDVQEIIVENNRHYTAVQIIERAGASLGQSIFTVRVNELRDNLLLDPYMRTVRVRRELPSTIIITVDERSELAKVPYSNRFIVIDNQGLVLRHTYAELDLPRLVGMTIRVMDEGRPLEIEETAVFSETLRMLEAMQDGDLFFREIDISNVVVRAQIFDQLFCVGTPENIIDSIRSGALTRILYEKYLEQVDRGTIFVASDNFVSFYPGID